MIGQTHDRVTLAVGGLSQGLLGGELAGPIHALARPCRHRRSGERRLDVGVPSEPMADQVGLLPCRQTSSRGPRRGRPYGEREVAGPA